ncbi:G protein-coupled receptor 141 [Amia ocellicauda]|uniref:G protein-coupled receptor 141 n=1 Tax=Amia ocellicauda TaxID=2972642 RepID=UPI00346398B4
MGENNTSTVSNITEPYRTALIIIYSTVLIGGSVGIILVIFILKSNIRSVTTTAVLNLIAVHSIFLLTVPFRIYFYVESVWSLGRTFCKLVSAMIHAHMYIAFVFYVTILVIRYRSFYKGTDKVEFYRKLHALGASALVWAIMLIIVLPVYIIHYGASNNSSSNTCFQFQSELEKTYVIAVNYTIIVIILGIAFALTCCQIHIIWKISRKYKTAAYAHQEFWAQIKSLSFVLVMFLCFVPYHVFRIYYIQNLTGKQHLFQPNEVFLALTALSCFDLLTFVGRGTFDNCNQLYNNCKNILPCC